MKDIIEKLSSYNFFNNLLPGVLFAALTTRFTSFTLTTEDLLIAFFVYYLIGLVISRIGSLIIEPILIKCKFVEYAEYSNYLKACETDQEIKTLLEVNNTYRTLIALLLSLFVIFCFDLLSMKYHLLLILGPYLFGFILLVLFAWSFKKQTKFIKKRIENQLEK